MLVCRARDAFCFAVNGSMVPGCTARGLAIGIGSSTSSLAGRSSCDAAMLQVTQTAIANLNPVT
jgi:hypothetical protein